MLEGIVWKGCEGCNVKYSECLKARNRLRCSLLREQAEKEMLELRNSLRLALEEIGSG